MRFNKRAPFAYGLGPEFYQQALLDALERDDRRENKAEVLTELC